MYFSIFDLVLLFILFMFISFNFYVGFVGAVGSILGLIIGTWAAGFFFDDISGWLMPLLFNNANLASIVAFLIIFTIVNQGIAILFWIIGKVFKVFSIIPFTKTINRVLGAVLGFVEGVLATGIALYFIQQFNFSQWFADVLAGSQIAQWLIWVAGVLTPLLPEVVRAVQTII